MTIREVNIECRGRKVSFLLDIVPGRYYSDNALTHYLNAQMLPEPEVIHVMFRAIKTNDCVIDAGANIGFFTLLMSRLVGPGGKVIAIEPDSRNLEMLRKNLDINEIKNVLIETRPLSDGSRSTAFVQEDENGQSHLAVSPVNAADRMKAVETVTLDSVVGNSEPTFLKMDIEGSEYDALVGCRHEFDYIVTELNTEALARNDSSPMEMIDLMRSRGQSPFILHEDGTLPSRVWNTQVVKPTRPNANMLFTGRGIVDLWPEVEI